jgi:hypothetical protein
MKIKYLLFLYDFNELIIFWIFIPTDKNYKDVNFYFYLSLF